MTEEVIPNTKTYLRINHDKSFELVDLTDDEAFEIMNGYQLKPQSSILLRITGAIPHANITCVKDDYPETDVPCLRESKPSEEA